MFNINSKREKDMYGIFVENGFLSEDNLLKIGYTKSDIKALVDVEMICRVGPGIYGLDNVDGLFLYTEMLFGKKYRDLTKAKKALRKCANIDPDNYDVQRRLFLDFVMEDDYKRAIDTLMKMNDICAGSCSPDHNLWLFLLNYIVELSPQYKQLVNQFKLSDMLPLKGSLSDKLRLVQNRIRNAIFKLDFNSARELSETLQVKCSKGISAVITDVLLERVIKINESSHEYLYNLIMEDKLEEARAYLLRLQNDYKLNSYDRQFLFVIDDLIDVLNQKRVPVVDTSKKIVCFNDALFARDYVTLMKINKISDGKAARVMHHLLEKMCDEIHKLESSMPDKGEEIQEVKENDDRSTSINSDSLFAELTVSLINQDVDKALCLVYEYLTSIDKINFKDYVINLIKLSLLKDDKSFSEPILLLSNLARNQFDFNVATYIQDFYINTSRKRFREAAIYLEILSISGKLGCIEINTEDLKKFLMEEIKAEELKADELDLKLGVNEKESEVLQEAESQTIDEDVDNNYEQSESIEYTYSLEDAIDDILNDTNMIVFEPMSEDEIAFVLERTKSIPKVQASVIDGSLGEKRVVLRFYDKDGSYGDVAYNLEKAKKHYISHEYDEAIDAYQSVMPKMSSPRSFIYANLASCYREITDDGDYSKAIDYYIVAMALSKREKKPIDFTELISELRGDSEYNGVKFTLGDQPKQHRKLL